MPVVSSRFDKFFTDQMLASLSILQSRVQELGKLRQRMHGAKQIMNIMLKIIASSQTLANENEECFPSSCRRTCQCIDDA